MNLSGKKITIIGAGKSGLAATKLAQRQNGIVRISESGPRNHNDQDLTDWMESFQISCEFGGHTKSFIEDSDLIVLSPGVPIGAPVVSWARELNIALVGEIELAFQFCRAPIIAVTGSNGKTTVVSLIHDVLTKAGRKACLCGNLGLPFSDYVLDSDRYDYFVVEVSSFQLETIQSFKPAIAVFLNFSENHLDRHKDMDEYFEAKKRIFLNQTREDYAVLNRDDERIRALETHIKSKISFFTSSGRKLNGNFSSPNHGAVKEVAKIIGIREKTCQDVFKNFKGVAHRLELVRSINGVDFINDSKATTAESGRWAIEHINKPILMICGGRDKKIDFTGLSDLVKKKVKKVYVIGESQEKIKKAFSKIVHVEKCDDLKSAVMLAKKNAYQGDCVVLSPMCASFDMFNNFEERGDTFKNIVNSL